MVGGVSTCSVYLRRGLYRPAAQCLAAAEHVLLEQRSRTGLPTSDAESQAAGEGVGDVSRAEEPLLQTEHELEIHRGELYMLLLDDAKDKWEAQQAGQEVKSDVADSAGGGGEGGNASQQSEAEAMRIDGEEMGRSIFADDDEMSLPQPSEDDDPMPDLDSDDEWDMEHMDGTVNTAPDGSRVLLASVAGTLVWFEAVACLFSSECCAVFHPSRGRAQSGAVAQQHTALCMDLSHVRLAVLIRRCRIEG